MNQPPLNPDALEAAKRTFALTNPSRLCAYEDLPEKRQQQIDSQISQTIEAYLAVAQPEVNSVESIPAQVQVISWEEEPEHECWKLAPDETFVGLIVKSDRAWSPADKYTLSIERPEVNDA